jgi:hypothetical protein
LDAPKQLGHLSQGLPVLVGRLCVAQKQGKGESCPWVTKNFSLDKEKKQFRVSCKIIDKKR